MPQKSQKKTKVLRFEKPQDLVKYVLRGGKYWVPREDEEETDNEIIEVLKKKAIRKELPPAVIIRDIHLYDEYKQEELFDREKKSG